MRHYEMDRITIYVSSGYSKVIYNGEIYYFNRIALNNITSYLPALIADNIRQLSIIRRSDNKFKVLEYRYSPIHIQLDNVSKMSNITSMIIKDVGYKYIPDLSHISKLSILDVSDNQIITLDTESLPIYMLIINNNCLRSLDHIDNFVNLTGIYANHNFIKRLSYNNNTFTKLLHISLDNNLLDDINELSGMIITSNARHPVSNISVRDNNISDHTIPLIGVNNGDVIIDLRGNPIDSMPDNVLKHIHNNVGSWELKFTSSDMNISKLIKRLYESNTKNLIQEWIVDHDLDTVTIKYMYYR